MPKVKKLARAGVVAAIAVAAALSAGLRSAGPDVRMYIAHVTPGGLSFTIENNTEAECIYGESYALYTRSGGFWEPVEPVIDSWAWDWTGYTLPPRGKSETITVDWRRLFGELPRGGYKFQKDISARGSGAYCVSECEFSLP